LPESTLPPQPATPDSLDLAKARRLRQALTAQKEEIPALIQDPDPDVLRSLLKNPQLGEDQLLVLLKRRDLGEQLVKGIGKLPLVSASRRLLIALTAHPQAPAPLLSTLLPQLFLFELVTLLQLPGSGADLKLAAERAILKRLPETELGNRIALARRGTPALLEALLKQGEPRLLEAVLENPRLKEAGLHSFLRSASATPEAISAVARHPRWGKRPNLRFAMLRNRHTPTVWFTLFLPELGPSELEAVAASSGLTAGQRAEVQREWARRTL